MLDSILQKMWLLKSQLLSMLMSGLCCSRSQQRMLRQEAAEEMGRRAKLSHPSSPAAAFMQADNVIDAAASGEDLTNILNQRKTLV